MTTSFSKVQRFGAVVALAGVLYVLPIHAQVSPLTDAEKNGNRPAGGPPPAARQREETSVKPSSDPRDFRGSYSAMGGGGPDGGGPGGVPGGGGPPGGGAGGPPGGGSPPEYKSTLYCIPFFAPLGGVEGGVDILQTADEITLVGEERHAVRHIYLTDKHDADAKPSYMGNSIGHWEGDTLIVETTQLRENGTINERMSKDKDGNIVDVVTEKDSGERRSGPPGGAGGTFKLTWQPGNDPLEWICEDFSDNYMKLAKDAIKKPARK